MQKTWLILAALLMTAAGCAILETDEHRFKSLVDDVRQCEGKALNIQLNNAENGKGRTSREIDELLRKSHEQAVLALQLAPKVIDKKRDTASSDFNSRVENMELQIMPSYLNSIANTFEQEDDIADAERAYQLAVAAAEKFCPSSQPDTSGALAKLGKFYCLHKRLNEARPVLERAVKLAEQAVSAGKAENVDADKTKDLNTNLSECISELALWSYLEKDTKTANKLYIQALKIDPDHGTSLEDLANDCLAFQDKPRESAELYQKAIALREAAGVNPIKTAQIYAYMANAYSDVDVHAAENAYKKCWSIAEAHKKELSAFEKESMQTEMGYYSDMLRKNHRDAEADAVEKLATTL